MAYQVTPHVLSIAPFTDKELYALGLAQNWQGLRRIVGPLTGLDFAVVDGCSQFLVDDTRRQFDSSVADETRKRTALQLIMGAACNDNGIGATLELLLSVGVHPDKADASGWRPSHSCASIGQYSASRAILLCRPDMEARNPNGDTPLEAALRKGYMNDEKFPERMSGRDDVASFIQNENLEQDPYSLAGLAVRKIWFAVKNLIRRQVIPSSEFEEEVYGKTAAEWADHFGEKLMAAELRYYASLPSAKLLEAEKKIEDLEEQVEKKDMNMKNLRRSMFAKDTALAARDAEAKAAEAKWKEEMKSLQERCTAYEQKIEELTETVSVVTARLPGDVSDKEDEPGPKRAKLQCPDSMSVDGEPNGSKIE